ncbi:SAM-dependent methyltransferase [Haloactinomyces albus]|uniref:S-adenosyl methyltransferase n=1 Tax=Haloactinomyces albus TaxID=1352928 RepID=A0AAE3ZIF8_9ACTN|nr:SAM-dependent methyltransferase [Haloactinomyces albus]MDR7303802.1 hypothetical protein [Haloactinomyces albus]
MSEQSVPRSFAAVSDIDLTQPNPARMYDYGLGGDHNFEVDRRQIRLMHELNPDGPLVPRENRAFLHRAVCYALGRGIDQFLDLGSGIPTVGNVHEIAQRHNPAARVVYVDNEQMTVAHTRHLLRNNTRAAVVQADLRDPEAVLTAPETAALLDFDRPVAVIMVAALHYVSPGDDITTLMQRYRAALTSGSVVAISHMTADDRPELMHRLQTEVFADSSSPLTVRTHADVTALFTGFDLISPGVVYTSQWRPDPASEPDSQPERALTWCGVAIKP